REGVEAEDVAREYVDGVSQQKRSDDRADRRMVEAQVDAQHEREVGHVRAEWHEPRQRRLKQQQHEAGDNKQQRDLHHVQSLISGALPRTTSTSSTRAGSSARPTSIC